jgi:hypothetical protein
MAKTGIRIAAWVLLAIVAGGVGYLAGSSRQIRASIRTLQVEARGNLIQRIETLSLLRMGDVPGAIDRLESEADRLTVSMAANPGADEHAIAYMKTYLSVAPPSPDRERALSAALAGVPVLEPGRCNSGLRALLLSARPATQDFTGVRVD